MSDSDARDRDDLLIAGDEQVRGRLRPVAVVAAALLLVGTAVVVEQRRADQAQDRAAAAQVRLAVAGRPAPTDPSQGLVGIGLRNLGPEPVRLVSARLHAPGYDEQALSSDIGAGAWTAIYLPDTAPCRPGSLTLPAGSLVVRLETHRGTRIERTLPLSPAAFVAVNHAARTRCGYQPAGDAFAFDVTAVDEEEGTVLLRGRVANRSVLPLRLDLLQAMPGLSLRAAHALPLNLPTQSAPELADSEMALTLQLRVASCTTFLETMGERHDGVTSGAVLRAWVVRGSSITEAAVGLAGSSVTSTALALLKRQCPIQRQIA